MWAVRKNVSFYSTHHLLAASCFCKDHTVKKGDQWRPPVPMNLVRFSSVSWFWSDDRKFQGAVCSSDCGDGVGTDYAVTSLSAMQKEKEWVSVRVLNCWFFINLCVEQPSTYIYIHTESTTSCLHSGSTYSPMSRWWGCRWRKFLLQDGTTITAFWRVACFISSCCRNYWRATSNLQSADVVSTRQWWWLTKCFSNEKLSYFFTCLFLLIFKVKPFLT